VTAPRAAGPPKLLVIGRPHGWHARDLQRAARDAAVAIAFVEWSALHAFIPGVEAAPPSADDRPVHAVGAGGACLPEADVVLLRPMPAASLEAVIFRMDLLGQLERAGVRMINPPRAVEVAVDKYLSLARMVADGLPVPATAVTQSPAEAMAAFDRMGRDVVVKPLFGSEGFGVTRVTDPALAERAFVLLHRLTGVVYLQQWIAPARRRSDVWPANAARGGRLTPAPPDAGAEHLARLAARACGAWFAGVDLIEDAHHRMHILEVNTAPGWRRLAEATDRDLARELIDRITDFAPGARSRA